jgi:hypothetical protein
MGERATAPGVAVIPYIICLSTQPIFRGVHRIILRRAIPLSLKNFIKEYNGRLGNLGTGNLGTGNLISGKEILGIEKRFLMILRSFFMWYIPLVSLVLLYSSAYLYCRLIKNGVGINSPPHKLCFCMYVTVLL